ncbi:MAG: Acetyl esterase/lipase [Verrucomicrobia bacterium]|nr:MAG: Acetyl esterase/lipase [Verrucomicrobiota bacterium]
MITPSRCSSLFLAAQLLLPPVQAFSSPQPGTPEKLPLWHGEAPIGGGATAPSSAAITVHLPEHPNGAAMVICPGGGYGGLVTGAEGHGIATWLNAHGIAGIVLEYRLPKGNAFLPLADAQRAIRTTRARAGDWKINPEKIGIIGFSAGGHLASTAGTHFSEGQPASDDLMERVSSRPDFMVLVYPVVTMGAGTHAGSKKNLLGENPSAAAVENFSNEKQVSERTPPAYLAHALNDTVVPPEHSSNFYKALQAARVPSRYLELPSGGHGLNGYKGPMWEAWQAGALGWLQEMGFTPADK